MNTSSNNIKIEELFEKYICHPKFPNELLELISEKSLALKFYKIFEKNTKMLETFGYEANKVKNFEKLKKAPGLYSMKFPDKNLNIRIIYSYVDGALALLLCCFDEKDDSGQYSYEKYIPIAEERKKEMQHEEGIK